MMTNRVDSLEIPGALLEQLRNSAAVAVLTGAGTSAESGVPTFRGAQTGLWAQYDPLQLATPQAFRENPRLVMDWYRWRRELVDQAQPNLAHTALAAFEKQAPRFTLITQNVDGLHARAGSLNRIELHGSLQWLRCSAPGCASPTQTWPDEDLPRCSRCGALLRPDVVWFGEMLPTAALDAAVQASRDCDLFFSIGTSGVVEPAASLPYEALHSGAVIVEINPQPTPLTARAHYYFPEPAGQVLPRLVTAAWPGALDC